MMSTLKKLINLIGAMHHNMLFSNFISTKKHVNIDDPMDNSG